MSFTITTDVFCDFCPQWMSEGGATGGRMLKTEAWKRALSFGWQKVGNKHACPKCRTLTADEKDEYLSNMESIGAESHVLESSVFNFSPEKPKKCANCGRLERMHRARTAECPIGQRTRVGYTAYGPNVFKEKKVK